MAPEPAALSGAMARAEDEPYLGRRVSRFWCHSAFGVDGIEWTKRSAG